MPELNKLEKQVSKIQQKLMNRPSNLKMVSFSKLEDVLHLE
jgi:hypothetical protein